MTHARILARAIETGKRKATRPRADHVTAAFVPRARVTLILYHVVVAPRSAWRATIVRSLVRRAACRLLVHCSVVLATLVAPGGCASRAPSQTADARIQTGGPTLAAEDEALLEDLSKRSFMFFWEQANPTTGIVRDRSRTDGSPVEGRARDVGSIAAVGFGLSGMCIAAERQWVPRDQVVARTRTTLRYVADELTHERGWYYHFINLDTGAREWNSELSSMDTALLLAGVLTVRQCFAADREIPGLAETIYRRVDFQWMLAGDPLLLSHGWTPESGFLKSRWDHYAELMVLYLLGIGSPTHPIPGESWRAWRRPLITVDQYSYIGGPPPLFVHQFAHAWVDFRGWREREPPHTDWFENSVIATRAHKAFVVTLSSEFPGYTENIWGLTSSDSRKGYVAWGGPPRHDRIDGSVVPSAAAGSLMFTPDITVPVMREMHQRFGDRIYGRYGFADAFHPTDGWVNPDVIGIDVGITLLSAENLRTGRLWTWFMQNAEIPAAMQRAGLVH